MLGLGNTQLAVRHWTRMCNSGHNIFFKCAKLGAQCGSIGCDITDPRKYLSPLNHCVVEKSIKWSAPRQGSACG